YQYMQTFDKHYSELINAQKFGKAVEFADTVIDGLNKLIEKTPVMEVLAQSEIAEWSMRQASARSKERALASAQEEQKEFIEAGDHAHSRIESLMNVAEIQKARVEIDKFLEEFKDHPKFDVIQTLKNQLIAS